MTYEPRTIAFGAELLWAPLQLSAEPVQKIYNDLFQEREISYQNFQVAQDGIHLSNPSQTPGAISSASFRPDRLVLREEFRPCTVEEFATRLVNVAGHAFQDLPVQLSVAQQFWVRSLVNPHSAEPARQFLSERLLQGGQQSLTSFGRPLLSVGLRYTFPQTEQHGNVYSLRIEPWTQDERSVWFEVIGQFARPVGTEDLPDLGKNMFATYKFLTGPAFEYFEQFEQG